MEKSNSNANPTDDQNIDQILDEANGGSLGSAIQDVLELPFNALFKAPVVLPDEMKKRERTGTDGFWDGFKYQFFPNTMNEKVDDAIEDKLNEARAANDKAKNNLGSIGPTE